MLIGGLFVGLVVSHEPISRVRIGRGEPSVSTPGLARLEGRWAGTGVEGLEYLDVEHPYAADLDLFGGGSMFERLCSGARGPERQCWRPGCSAPAEPEDRGAAPGGRRTAAPAGLCARISSSRAPRSGRGSTRPRWPPGVPRRAFHGRALPLVAAVLALLATAAVIGWLFLETRRSPC